MDEAAWKTSRELARETGIAESTVRRYLEVYNTFFINKQLGRRTIYAPGAATILKRIKELHDEGRVVDQVRATLEQEHTQTLTTAPTALPTETNQDMAALIREHRDILKEIATTAEGINTTLPQIQEQIETMSHGSATAYQGLATRLDQVEQGRKVDTMKTNLVIIGCFAAFIIVILVLFLLR